MVLVKLEEKAMEESMSKVATFIAGFDTVDPKTLSTKDWYDTLLLAEKQLLSFPLLGMYPLHILLEGKSPVVDDKPCHRVHPAVMRQLTSYYCQSDTKFFELAELSPLPSMESKNHLPSTSRHVLFSRLEGGRFYWHLDAEWIPNWEEFHLTGQERLQLTHYRLSSESRWRMLDDRNMVELIEEGRCQRGLQLLKGICRLQQGTTDKRREQLELDERCSSYLQGFLRRLGQH
ncbi:hypothetical protein A3A40_01455 [Candidatus Kaiserbacteria bacterium RIFCSPLOWO2_01_FULL_54_20]|uniref:Uncharacterized protein n=1 Tax=Candidatus Kaiserbacteria bacterium RIFCSPLOWO2_01_FULL_54_20 TaxID=1798513 RepID=A0A1F6EJ22_9BACT|nr:MAG: hypothetical protein A3A40_01455 [Candidatus Kaiserbacteria bacterium RIFCSPLOWO2_01_FULL_54_20]